MARPKPLPSPPRPLMQQQQYCPSPINNVIDGVLPPPQQQQYCPSPNNDVINEVLPPPSPPQSPRISLHEPSQKKNPSKSNKLLRRFRSVFRSFPIISTPAACKFQVPHHHGRAHNIGGLHIHGGTRLTGTLFGYRRSRINLAIQENPRCLPMLLLELSIPTGKMLQDMGLGLLRMAMECEKNSSGKTTKLINEPIWTMFCNGRKTGYAVKREATDEDLKVMQTLHATSMGAGVLPGDESSPSEGDLTYMRAFFERVIGSRDSETYYMMNPDTNSGPELSIFFVRI